MHTLFKKEKPTVIDMHGTTHVQINNFRGTITMTAKEPDNVAIITAFESALLTHEPQTIINALERLDDGL